VGKSGGLKERKKIFWSGEEWRVKREKKYILEWGRVEG
jgi:hypothetical protein